MAREVLENLEDHFNSIHKEWGAMKEKWFHGETMDPVFEGVVRDFCTFDETMQNVHQRVGVFMKSIEQLATGMTSLADGVSTNLTHAKDHQIASDSCKLKEATQQIARSDAPHSAIAKLRRDMQFNILSPVQNHIANNRNLKMSLDIRRQRLVELNSAKKQMDNVTARNLGATDRRYLQAQANFESAKMTFNDVDRHVFEWLYILEEYRGDILDSTLQTLKYLEYEFFAASAHALSASLPARMEFRPMVEMTPEHLEAQVDMELAESEQADEPEGMGSTAVADFSLRLIDKQTRAEDGKDAAPVLPVDPLSLSSLLAQGFDEGPARRALRLHQNNTQLALEWLLDGNLEEEEKRKVVSEGVRMPTTVKRVQKLRAMRKAQQDKGKDKQDKREETSSSAGNASGSSGNAKNDGASSVAERSGDRDKAEEVTEKKSRAPPEPQADLLSMDDDSNARVPTKAKTDLLGFDDDAPAVPTDFTKPIERTELPPQLMFDASRCEKPPLAAAVAAGIVQPRETAAPADGWALASSGVSPELMQQVQSLALQSQVSPEHLLRAAQQLQQEQVAASPLLQALPGSSGYPDNGSSASANGGLGTTSGMNLQMGGQSASLGQIHSTAAAPSSTTAPASGFDALNALAMAGYGSSNLPSAAPPASAADVPAASGADAATPDLMAFASAGFDSAK